MVNGLLKKIALGTAIAGSALFGAKEASAASLPWSSFSEVVGSIPEGYSQNYTSSNSSILPNKCSGILYYLLPDGSSTVAIGGFDLSNGHVTQSYFGDVGEAYSANTGIGANPNYSWLVFYDKNGDGNFGKRNTDGYIEDFNEVIDPSKYQITKFTKYGFSNPTFEFSTSVPEPTVLTYLALGSAITLALRRRREDESGKKQFLA